MLDRIQRDYGDSIEEIVDKQRNRHREAIFFMYADGTTSETIVGEATHIKISKDQKDHIFNSGDVIGSVHTHPAGFDPSTIDIMTAISTNQDLMCVAVPITYEDGTQDYTLSCIDLENAGRMGKRSLFRGMRRSMFSVSRTGKDLRKSANIQFSDAEGHRSHDVVRDGVKFPAFDRPSYFNLEAGTELGVTDGEVMFLD